MKVSESTLFVHMHIITNVDTIKELLKALSHLQLIRYHCPRRVKLHWLLYHVEHFNTNRANFKVWFSWASMTIMLLVKARVLVAAWYRWRSSRDGRSTWSLRSPWKRHRSNKRGTYSTQDTVMCSGTVTHETPLNYVQMHLLASVRLMQSGASSID